GGRGGKARAENGREANRVPVSQAGDRRLRASSTCDRTACRQRRRRERWRTVQMYRRKDRLWISKRPLHSLCDLQLTSVAKGALNAITYAGMISSSLLWGALSDRLGRHRLLVAGYLLDFACGAASAFARELWVMLLLRYLVGFLICGPYAILMSYLAEFHGAQYRSRIIMFTGVAVSIANFSLPALAWGLLPMPWEYSLLGGAFVFKPWHAFVLLCSTCALVSGLLVLPFGESPKFLMSRGRREEALAQFQRVYAANTGNPRDMYP
ncbi:Organic cation transporter protein, partial [Gryllus bimaculatus]